MAEPEIQQDPLKIQFSQSLWDQFQFVIKENQHNRAQLKQFLSMLEARSKIEFKYSQQLLSLCTNKFDHKNNMSAQLIKIYVLSVRRRADQARILSERITEDIAYKLRSVLQSTAGEIKKNVSQGKQWEKQLSRINEQIEKNRIKYMKKQKEYEQSQVLHFAMSQCKQYGVQKKINQKQKVKQKNIQFLASALELRKSIDQYNQIRKTFTTNMKEIIKIFYQFEHQRLDKTLSSVMNMQLIQSSAFRNSLYEIQQNSRYVNLASVQKEIEEFILKNEHKVKTKTDILFYEDQKNFINKTFIKIESKQFEQLIKYGNNHKTQIQKFFAGEIIESESKTIKTAKFFQKVWNGEEDLSNPQVQQFNNNCKSIYGRKDFIMCMQQLRSNSKVQINKNNLQNILHILKIFLDNCYSDKDSYNGKQFMILIFTYYVLQNQIKKILHKFLKDHKFWKQKDFWESALIESLYQQSKGYQKISSIQSKPNMSELQKEQNLIFNQLTYYIQNMIQFDINQKDIRVFAQKFIKLYNVNEERAKQIYAIIPSNEGEPDLEKPSIFSNIKSYFS